VLVVFSALTLLVGRQEGHLLACKKTEWWGAGVVVCLERGTDLHTTQLMTLPLTVSCFSKIQIGFTFLVPALPGSPGQRAVKRVCVCLLSFCCRYACRGLFERHKLLFSFHMCAKILEAAGKLNVDEYNFFLRGGIVSEIDGLFVIKIL